jgi:hypothetical protein
VVGLGDGASVNLTSSSSGSGVQGIGSTSGGYGGWFTGGLTTAPLHLTPQASTPSGIGGDFYVDSSGGAPYSLKFHDGTGWKTVTIT